MALSRRALVALEALIAIAINTAAGPVSAADLAEQMNMSKRALDPVLQALTKAGYLVSTRGPAGGYELGVERTRLSALAVVAAIDGENDEDDTIISDLGREIVEPVAMKVADSERAILGGLTLADLKAAAEAKGFGPQRAVPIDYAI